MFRGVILVFSGVMLGFRRVIFGSEGLYRVQWGYVVSIQHVDLPPCRAGSAVKNRVSTCQVVILQAYLVLLFPFFDSKVFIFHGIDSDLIITEF